MASGKAKASRKLGYDPFCFSCHERVTDVDGQTCPQCKLSYHADNECTNFDSKESGTICSNCEYLNQNEELEVFESLYSLYETINFILIKLFKEFKQFLKINYRNLFAFCLIDLERIKIKNNSQLYRNLRQFQIDIQTIAHNVEINRSILKLNGSEEMLDMVEREIEDVYSCVDCFMLIHASNTVCNNHIRICNSPHGVVWAPMEGRGYWPAKVFKTSNSNIFQVRYFGHDIPESAQRSNVHLSELFLYSIEFPAELPQTEASIDFEIARLQTKAYFNEYAAFFNICHQISQKTKPFDSNCDLFLAGSFNADTCNVDNESVMFYDARLQSDIRYEYDNLDVRKSLSYEQLEKCLLKNLKINSVSDEFKTFFNQIMLEHESLMKDELDQIAKMDSSSEEAVKRSHIITLYNGMIRQQLAEMLHMQIKFEIDLNFHADISYHAKQLEKSNNCIELNKQNVWCIYCQSKTAVIQCCELGFYCSESCSIAGLQSHSYYCDMRNFT